MRRVRSAALDESAIRQLFAAPPTEFVAARNELAKSLRREKRREEATAVAALRRPGWDDWALNIVAAEQPQTVDAFTSAAADVREAQAAAIEGRDGPDVRDALKSLRDRSAELVALATEVLGRVGRQPGPGELTARLSEVAASDTAAAQLRAAVLGSGDAGPDDVFADLEPASRPAPRSKPDEAGEAAEARRRRRAATARRHRRGDGEARHGDGGIAAGRGRRVGGRAGAAAGGEGARRGAASA